MKKEQEKIEKQLNKIPIVGAVLREKYFAKYIEF